MKYFTLPTCHIPFNAKVGSSTLACAIVKKFYPEIETKILLEHEEFLSKYSPNFFSKLPKSFTENPMLSFGIWQRICPQTDTPDKMVLLPVRDPIKRFISSVSLFNFNVNEVLDSLENNKDILWEEKLMPVNNDIHFVFQHNFIMDKLYKFPEHLKQLAIDAGLSLPLPIINKTKQKKPTLDKKQIERVKSYYKEDFVLYNNI